MGRHRKPLAERLAEGTYRPDRHGPIDGGQLDLLPSSREGAPPDHLPPYGREVWARLYPLVTEHGFLTDGERELFIAYCEAAGMFDKACRELAKNGVFEKIPGKRKKGAPASSFSTDPEPEMKVRRNPWYDVKREAAADLSRMSALLGLTAVDRSRVVKAKAATGGKGPPPLRRPKTSLDGLGPLGVVG